MAGDRCTTGKLPEIQCSPFPTGSRAQGRAQVKVFGFGFAVYGFAGESNPKP